MSNSIVEQDLKDIYRRLKPIFHKLENKTLLITGGAGFLGSYFLQTISYVNKYHFRKPCKVICVDNYITALKNNPVYIISDSHLQFIEHNVIKPLRLRRKIHYIIHAAGIAAPIYYRKYQIEAIEVNTFGTKHLLELARKNRVQSFLYFSSSEIYGDPTPENIPTPETYRGNVSCIGPRSCYDESKRLGEALSMTYYAVHKTPIKIVRPFNIYGPGMKPKDYRVIPTFVYFALAGKLLPVHDTGKQTRTYCYISDAIVALFKVLLAGRDGEVYNVGNDTPEITTKELAGVIAKQLKDKAKIELIPYPLGYPTDVPQRRCPDLTKIRNHLNYIPRVSLEKGLKRTLVWCKKTYGVGIKKELIDGEEIAK